MVKDFHEPPPKPGGNKDETPMACPFCGSADFSEGSWYLDEAGEDYEIEAWECNQCKAGAPKRVWNQRAKL